MYFALHQKQVWLYSSKTLGNQEKRICCIKILKRSQYHVHEWLICVDLKMVNFFAGSGKRLHKILLVFFSCYLAYRATADHQAKKKLPSRRSLTPGEKNIINDPLVQRNTIVFPPLYITLHLMKQFVKAFNHNVHCFYHIYSTFAFIKTLKLQKSATKADETAI